MQPVQRHSLIHQVTAALRAEIASGAWPVGERIPTEGQLCELTGAGRNTVREAVQALVHAGLLERRQGSGTYVLAASEVPAALRPLLSAAEHRHVMELRLALEVSAAELAAERRSAEQLAAMKLALGERLGARRELDHLESAAADVRLHRAIVAAAGNPVFMEVYDSILPNVERVVAENVASPLEAGHDAEHVAIIEAIERQDASEAGAAVRRLLTGIMAESSGD